MASAPQNVVSPDEYLAFDRQSEFKHEYLDGVITDMSGGTPRHAHLPTRLIVALSSRLPAGCSMFTSDLRVCVDRKRLYAHPDLTVVCGPLQFRDDCEDTIINPKVIAEVLSPTTENYDRGTKWNFYRQIPTLSEYLLVAQEPHDIVVYSRLDDTRWKLTAYTEPTAVIELQSLGITFPISEIYGRLA